MVNRQGRVCNTFVAVLLSAFILLLATLAVRAGVVTGTESWRNYIVLPGDPFINYYSSGFGQPGWIKFMILLDSPGVVYFQDSVRFPFHYDFATQEMPAFLGMTRPEFDAVTLFAAGQQAVLGAVLVAPTGAPEYGIQLIRSDGYSAAEVIGYFTAVQSAVQSKTALQAFYFPTFEQQEAAEEATEELLAAGIEISSVGRWASSNSCYSRGWAAGTLKFITGSQINNAFLSGALQPDDILLTDGVPAEIPPLAGIMTLAPSTPNSHVAILAQTFNTPFVHLALEEDAQRALDLVGRLVAFDAVEGFGGCRARIIDVQDEFTPELLEEVLGLHQPPPLDIAVMAPFGAYSVSVQDLTPADTQFVGGKASHFGYLRRSIPGNCHIAQGLSFDVWNQYLDQIVSTGRTLREEIAFRLAPHSVWPPQDMAGLAATLTSIRGLFTSTSATSFDPELQAAIYAALQDPQFELDPLRKIRFRSSTNVEDSAQFTGAGLYESFSGCLADDLNGHTGPSLCDPAESGPRGVFRAIRRTFASFYNQNAYLERLRHGVDENVVGMAVLVHPSFPDPIEMANGVAVYTRDNSFSDTIRMVTQLGALSVTNPEGGAIPEEVDVYVFGTENYLTLRQSSSLVILGETVMNWESDYQQFANHLRAVADWYQLETGLNEFTLDFEYKKTATGYLDLPNDKLWVTQVRPLPQPDDTPTIAPLLINDPVDLCVHQGEGIDLFGSHYLKTTLHAQSRTVWLTLKELNTGLLDEVTYQFTDDCGQATLSGPIDSLPDASYLFAGGVAQHGWRLDDISNPRDMTIHIGPVPALVSPDITPFLTLRDLAINLQAQFDKPVLTWTVFPQGYSTATEVTAILEPCRTVSEGMTDREVLGTNGSSVVATTRYWWPPVPTGGILIYTAPLGGFYDTTIEGLTAEPIVLTSPYAQTYLPGHHNFTEQFLFEPLLDANLPASQRQELRDAGVRFIHMKVSSRTDFFDVIAADPNIECPPLAPGDLNGDGFVNVLDLLIVIGAWGNCLAATPNCPADFNGDAVVNVLDLLFLIQHWG